MVTLAAPPRVRWVPDSVESRVGEAVELAGSAGLVLDDHQRDVLDAMLSYRDDGKFAAFEVGCVEPRQNGKGAIQEARELAGVELLGEKLLIHSAHEYATALEAFYRMSALVEEAGLRVKKLRNAHGEQGIDFANGARLRYRTRTRGGGRGFSCDYLGLDEAMILPEFAHSALLYTLSARPNPQVGYFGSAVDQTVHEHGVVLARVRHRGLSGEDPALAYFEWSLPFDHPDEVPEEVAGSEDAWADANPAFGTRIFAEHVAKEHRSASSRGFAVERLGVGDWPSPDGEAALISSELWDSLEDARSAALDPVWFAIDVSPDRSRCAISVSGRRQDGLFHIEVVDHRPGTGWVVERCAELRDRHRPSGFVLDGIGPASALIEPLADVRIEAEPVSTTEHARSCGLFFDAAHQSTVRHLGSVELRQAVRGAATRPLGDSWAWSRKNSSVDITPLVSCTLALGAVFRHTKRVQPMVAFT